MQQGNGKTMEEPRMITNPRELINDVGNWATRQPWHPNHAPDYGVVEEIGELCHGVLKNLQKIRGMEDLEKFRKHTLDALGDIMVYLSHWCYLNNTYYTLIERVEVPQQMEMRHCVVQLLNNSARMLSLWDSPQRNIIHSVTGALASNIAQTLQYVAKMFGWRLMEECVYPTWQRVRLRDFNKNRASGGREEIEELIGAPKVAPRPAGDTEGTALDPRDIEGEKPVGAQL